MVLHGRRPGGSGVSVELVIPPSRELEALSPNDRWDLEDMLGGAQETLRAFNDDELRRWVEVEGKTQREIAELVDRSRQRIAQRASRLGLVPRDNRGGQRLPSPRQNGGEAVTDDGSSEEVDGEVVDDVPPDPGPRVQCPTCRHMVKPGDIEAWRA